MYRLVSQKAGWVCSKAVRPSGDRGRGWVVVVISHCVQRWVSGMTLIYPHQPLYSNQDLFPRWLQAVLERGNPVVGNSASVEPVLLVVDCRVWRRRHVTIITRRWVDWILVNWMTKVGRESKSLMMNYLHVQCVQDFWLSSDAEKDCHRDECVWLFTGFVCYNLTVNCEFG